ncbi:MFS transporter [Pseudomonas sp. ADAK13]|uniref:MFS transporter n=1 Tax=Pseudomonas sp. ADAK13 TaxID=2730847 RepID=UPI001462A898|nr:MFS transporter [Pseudomonas sp. ADAK13]QJI38166.1 MFS transporter [Pseudomonas sp. ADAK13]
MFDVLGNRTYRHLFLAQIIALIGTGLTTVALGLLAFDLAGAQAGAVLGTALAIKMAAYIGVAPVAAAFAERLPRRAMLVTLDLTRALVALALPFVTQVWEIYLLIFVLQSASAAFTPTFQATIPDILTDEKQYTQALSLARLAYDMESVVSPMLAAALLTVISFHSLFAGTSVGFVVSALLVSSVLLPQARAMVPRSIYERTTRGVRIFLATPRLRGLLALNLAVAAASSMVIVNTVVLVQSRFELPQRFTAMALAAFGAGSMIAALALPGLLKNISDRVAMLAGGGLLIVGLSAGIQLSGYGQLWVLWCVLGVGYSLAQTPGGRLLRRSAHAEDRPALFAAQFALSHVCWLITYPLAGWLSANAGLVASFAAMAVIAVLALMACVFLWRPGHEQIQMFHRHDDLPVGHPHLALNHGGVHRHDYVIDDLHRRWPA